jgi:hypothetical protein
VPPQTRTKLPERNQEQKAIVQVEPLGSQVVINPQLGEVLKYGNPGAQSSDGIAGKNNQIPLSLRPNIRPPYA